MSNVASVTKKLKKEFGDDIGGQGATYKIVDRIPTDWFEFDLSSGGGFPRGMVSIVYGPEGSGKTTMSYRLIAQHQRRWPKLKCAVIDVENVFAPDWAKQMGVNCEDLFVFRPDFVEQAGDVIETLLYADDCGLVVLDSLAALDTKKSIDDPMDKAQMAGASIPIKRMCGKVTAALRAKTKEGKQPPTVLYINQIRTKVGQLFGNPETQPGGNTPRFQSSFTVRTWSKPVKDDSVSKTLPAARNMIAQIQKYRVRVCSIQSEWEMKLIARPPYPVGSSDDWANIKGYLEKYGFAKKGKKSYDLMVSPDGEVIEFPTQTALREALIDNMELMDQVRQAIITAVQADG